MAETISTNTINYFVARKKYLWHWADGGRVIEFANNKTICYRDDLTFILGELAPTNQLPLGTILLLLCACKDNCDALYDLQSHLAHVATVDGLGEQEYVILQRLKDEAYRFLKIVNSLPYELRSGLKRIALIEAVMAAISPREKDADLQLMLKSFNSGELDYLIRTQQYLLIFVHIKHDLSPLATALEVFSDKEKLEVKLRTGLNTLPASAPVLIPETGKGDLLSQLDEDSKTKALGDLTRKIMAALRIPMHLNGRSDFSLGGISDISNRGNFDKLLLSELAQDDLLLTARLANNEALFLQRETPPDNRVQQLGVFLDVTLKMWGMPRVFALSAALAFRESKQKNQQLGVWTLGGKESTLENLDTMSGVVNVLEKLDNALHCGDQLAKTIKQNREAGGKYILITGNDFLENAESLSYFLRVKNQLDFLVTVNRNGHIQLFQLSKGRQKLLNEARIDLKATVTRAKRKLRHYSTTIGLPAIMLFEPFPLYFPTSKVKMTQLNTFQTNSGHVIVTLDRRVLHWRDRQHGAIELVDCLELGGHYFGEIDGKVYILLKCRSIDKLKIYCFDLNAETGTVSEMKLLHSSVHTVKFIDRFFYLEAHSGLEVIDPVTLTSVPATDFHEKVAKEHLKVTLHYKNFNLLKKDHQYRLQRDQFGKKCLSAYCRAPVCR